MTWTPPNDWRDALLDALSEAHAERGIDERETCGRQVLENWTKRGGAPTMKTLVKVCTALGVKPSTVLLRAGL